MNKITIKLYVLAFTFLYTADVFSKQKKIVLTTTTGPFAALTDFLQTIVDFTQGPYSMFIAFVGVVVVAVGFMFAKDAGGIIGAGMKVVAGIGILFTAAGIIGMFK
jgi:type IV secretory pathway VirB2 component (pilin)